MLGQIGKAMFGEYVGIPFAKIRHGSVRVPHAHRAVILTTVVLAVALVIQGGIKFARAWRTEAPQQANSRMDEIIIVVSQKRIAVLIHSSQER